MKINEFKKRLCKIITYCEEFINFLAVIENFLSMPFSKGVSPCVILILSLVLLVEIFFILLFINSLF